MMLMVLSVTVLQAKIHPASMSLMKRTLHHIVGRPLL